MRIISHECLSRSVTTAEERRLHEIIEAYNQMIKKPARTNQDEEKC
jgi:hypothetical protein